MSDPLNWVIVAALALLALMAAKLLNIVWCEATAPADPKAVEVLRLLRVEPGKWEKIITNVWRGPGGLELWYYSIDDAWAIKIGGVCFHTTSSWFRPIDRELRREIWAMEQRHAEYMLARLKATR